MLGGWERTKRRECVLHHAVRRRTILVIVDGGMERLASVCDLHEHLRPPRLAPVAYDVACAEHHAHFVRATVPLRLRLQVRRRPVRHAGHDLELKGRTRQWQPLLAQAHVQLVAAGGTDRVGDAVPQVHLDAYPTRRRR